MENRRKIYDDLSVVEFEPSLIGASFLDLRQEIQSCIDADVKILHVDVMDGLFVPNFTIGPAVVAAVRKNFPRLLLDVHLMIYSPEKYIETFVAAGADEITFHIEATEDVEHVIDFIQKCGKKAGLAVKPQTGIEMVERYIPVVDKILVMTVEPGFGGQEFMRDMVDKIKKVQLLSDRAGKKIDIQVDGGINQKTGKTCIDAGANRLVTGSFFFSHPDRSALMQQLKKIAMK